MKYDRKNIVRKGGVFNWRQKSHYDYGSAAGREIHSPADDAWRTEKLKNQRTVSSYGEPDRQARALF